MSWIKKKLLKKNCPGPLALLYAQRNGPRFRVQPFVRLSHAPSLAQKLRILRQGLKCAWLCIVQNDSVFVFGWQSSFCICTHVEDLRSVSFHQPVVSFRYEPVYRATCTWLQIPCLTMLFLQLVTLVVTISVHHMDTRATHCSPDGYPCYSLALLPFAR